jgi:uncharacterized Zn-finger protein
MPAGATTGVDEMASCKTGRQPNAAQKYQIKRSDLPLSCPMPGMSVWNSHPRVYLPVEKTGEAKCGYCGAEFVLIESDQA